MRTLTGQVIILEGPDGSGKTTLANQLQDRYGATVVHHGPYRGHRDIAHLYLDSLLVPGPVVLDRSWLSEQIYGPVLRPDQALRVGLAQQRILERVALRRGGVVVRCLPPMSRILGALTARGKDDDGSLARAQEVVARYVEAAGMQTVLPTYDYDWTTATVQDDLAPWLDRHPPAPPEVPGVGSLRKPCVVLLGERVNANVNYGLDLPFCGLGGDGCSTWLTQELERAGVPETKLYWLNAYDDRDLALDPGCLEWLQPKLVFALGAHAGQWCDIHQVPAWRAVPHPQYWKRFRSGTPYPLIKQLKEVC